MTNLSARGNAVLIVEDEELLLEILSEEFISFGYDVVSACSGDVAIRMLQGGLKVDLLITDIRLPGSANGWTVAEEARRVLHHVPVIYVTGYTNEEAQHVPGSVIIAKPYRASHVIRAARGLGIHGTTAPIAAATA